MVSSTLFATHVAKSGWNSVTNTIYFQAVPCYMDKVLYWRVKQNGRWTYAKVRVDTLDEYLELVEAVTEMKP